MASPKADKSAPNSGTIIRAENGDILRYDETGMVMVLSDKVIADIARRLPKTPEIPDVQNISAERVDADVLGDIDAWGVHQHGEWYLFTANLTGKQGVRQFRRLVKPDNQDAEPAIIADASGPIRGILSLGGSRRATGYVEASNYPWHILAPADEIGAVGFAGTETAKPCKMLQPLPEMTHDAALADVLLSEQHQEHRALNLYMTRTETDEATSITALSDGLAYANVLAAAQTLQTTAKRLDKRAGILAFNLEFSLEDVESDAKTYCTGMLDLIAKLTLDLSAMGFRRPPFLATFDCGTHEVNDDPILRAQWELAWQGADYGLCYTAPGYMFTQDRFGRPDMNAVWQMAEMEARALEVLYNEEIWMCPTFLLAEREPDPNVIRVRARAMQDLLIDTSDPFGAGEACGFSIEGATNKVKITNVAVASDDTQDILLTFDKEPKGKNLTLLYAFGVSVPRNRIDYPSACGAIRDGWAFKSKTGKTLHRWALPAALPVH